MTHVTQVDFVNTSRSANRNIPSAEGVSVTISGPDADKVYNIQGEKSFKITQGSLFLLLDPNIDFSEKDFYTVYLNVTIPGYDPRSITVTFFKGTNNGYVEAVMIDLNNLPDEIVKETVTKGSLNGTSGLDQEIIINADNSTPGRASTEFSFPKGTVMKDDKGSVLTGNLEVSVASFSIKGIGATLFPGGILQSNVITKDGNNEIGYFTLAGFAEIVSTVGGKKAKTIEGNEITMKMSIDERRINPKTNAPYKEGDDIDVYSYHKEKNQWKYEQTVKIKANNTTANRSYLISNKYSAEINWKFIDVENYAFGTFGRTYTRSPSGYYLYVPVCKPQDYSTPVTWSALKPGETVPGVLEVYEASGLSTGVFEEEYTLLNRSKGVLSNYQEWYLGYFGSKVLHVSITDIEHDTNLYAAAFDNCTVKSLSINHPSPFKNEITCDFSSNCYGDRITPPVGTRLFYKESGSANDFELLRTFTVDNNSSGFASTSKLKAGKKYDFMVIYDTIKKYKNNVTINEGHNKIEIELPDDVCNQLNF